MALANAFDERVIVHCGRVTSKSTLGKMLKHIADGEARFLPTGNIRKYRTKRQVKKAVHKRDHRKCAYCGQAGDTIDHIIPRVKGGITSRRNCVSCCEPCNTRKSDRSVDEFIAGTTLNDPRPRLEKLYYGGITL